MAFIDMVECFSAVQCPELPSPTHGHIKLHSGRSYLAEATLICDEGYVTDGVVRQCQGDNTWSGGELSCRGMLIDHIRGQVPYQCGNFVQLVPKCILYLVIDCISHPKICR